MTQIPTISWKSVEMYLRIWRGFHQQREEGGENSVNADLEPTKVLNNVFIFIVFIFINVFPLKKNPQTSQ